MVKHEVKKESPLDLLMFVGGSHYTVESFISEAQQIGACKRFGGYLPSDIRVGESRVFLCHDSSDEQIKTLNIAEEDHKDWNQVFGYFTIAGILVVGDSKMIAEQEGIKLQKIEEEDLSLMSERGCGLLQMGGSYFVSEEDMQKLATHAIGVSGNFVVLDEPLVIKLGRFRGYKYCAGDELLGGELSASLDVSKLRRENLLIRRAAIKIDPPKGKRGRPKKMRTSFKETMIDIITPLRGKVVAVDKLIALGIKANEPLSSYPTRVYRNVLTLLARAGYAEIEKLEDGSTIVTVSNFTIEDKADA